jgi:hypothetical protein
MASAALALLGRLSERIFPKRLGYPVGSHNFNIYGEILLQGLLDGRYEVGCQVETNDDAIGEKIPNIYCLLTISPTFLGRRWAPRCQIGYPDNAQAAYNAGEGKGKILNREKNEDAQHEGGEKQEHVIIFRPPLR